MTTGVFSINNTATAEIYTLSLHDAPPKSCQNGSCGRPTSTVTCTALDQCHVAGTCDTTTGVCSHRNHADAFAFQDRPPFIFGQTLQNSDCHRPPVDTALTRLSHGHRAALR